jgi:hypothetical protein
VKSARARLPLLGLAVLFSVGVSGCLTGVEVSIPTLERERTVDDVLPEDLFAEDDSDMFGPNPGTSRFVGELEGIRIFLAHAKTPGQVCVIYVERSESSGAACGPPASVAGSNGRIEVQLTADGVIPRDDGSAKEWVLVNDDVAARVF